MMSGEKQEKAVACHSDPKRDEFKRMLDDCANGKIDFIILKNAARLSRLPIMRYIRISKEND